VNIEINNENDLKNILDHEQVNIFKVKYSNQKNIFNNYQKVIRSYKIDFFELALEALTNQQIWQVGNVLTYLIPYSEFNIEKIIEFYIQSYEKKNGTSHHFRITQKISETNLDISKKLLDTLLKENKPYTIPHISAILVTLHNKYNETQFDRVIEYLKQNDLIKRKSALGYLHLFDFSEDEYKIIFEELKNISLLRDKELDREVIYKVNDMLDKGYKYFSELLLFYSNEDMHIDLKYDISQILIFQDEKYFKEEWYKKLFISLSYIEYTTSIVDNIEQILINYLKNNEYDFIEKFITEWMRNSDIYKHEIPSFFDEFSNHNYFSSFITQTLNNEDDKEHLFISKNLSNNIELDRATMSSFSFEDYLFVCRKILGYFYEFDIQISMVFSILSVENLDERIKKLVIEIIVNHIGENYSSNTIEYLNKLDEKNLNSIEIEVKKIVLHELEKRNKEWQELPRLKELMSPSYENRVIQRTQGIAMSKAMKKSEEDSFFSMIFSDIPIRHGKGWFSEFQGTFTEVSYMQSHSHSIVVPTATRTHPIHYELETYNFRIIKKGE